MYKFLLLAILVAGLAYTAIVIVDRSDSLNLPESRSPSAESVGTQKELADTEPGYGSNEAQAWVDNVGSQIDKLIIAGQYQQAIGLINDNYAQASVEDLESFKQRVFDHGQALRNEDKLGSAIALFESYAQNFDDADAWSHLGSLAAAGKDWEKAVDALLKSSAQEYQPLAYQESLRALVRASSYLRARLEQQNDQLGILNLYKRLYDQHPNYPRFQLELAQSYLRLGETDMARPLLELLRSDLELGSLASEKLLKLNASESNTEGRRATGSRPTDTTAIAVPLNKMGSSFILGVDLNSRRYELLLDTGASITSLSTELIRKLGLQTTGQTVSLNTANGRRTAQLYRVNTIKLGPFQIDNLIVAEIEFGGNQRIQGLVGTDLLNLLSDQYGYVIDAQKSALIFTPK